MSIMTGSTRMTCLSYLKVQRDIQVSTCGGFTLIEVMLSLVFLAMGLLGMSALQNEALKYNHAAFIDSQAQFLLNDMAERIRANPATNSYVIGFNEEPPTVARNCLTQTCSATQMSTWDLTEWRGSIEDSDFLPSGESQILFNALTRTYVISIRYDWSSMGGVDITDGKRTVTITTRI